MKKYIHLIHQHDETDCGAACIAMILQHYGRKLPLPVLREDVRVDQFGANMVGLQYAAEKYGLHAECLAGTTDDFISEVHKGVIHLPVIAHIQNIHGFEHFIIVSAISKNKIYCCDPSDGLYALPVDVFKECFLGHIMTFHKTSEFICRNDCSNSFIRYLRLISRQKFLLALVAILSFFVTGTGLLGSYVFQFLIDNVMANVSNASLLDESLELFAVLIFGVAAVYFLRYLAQMLRGRLMMFMAKRINLPLMLGYYEHVIDLPMDFFSTRKTGDLISRFHDANKVQEALSNVTLTLLIDTVMVTFCGIVLYRISPTLFLVTLVILGTYTAISIIFIKPMGKYSRALMEENGELSSYLKESLDGIQTVKAFQLENYVKSHMRKLFIKIQENGIRFSLMGFRKNALIEFTSSIGILILLWAGACSVLDGNLTLGSLITFYTLLSYFLSPVQNLIELQSDVQDAIIAADRLNDILDAYLENKDIENTTLLRSGEILLDNVSFRYGNRKLTLDKLSMSIKSGQKVAIVGESGCGKTTVAKLLMGFYKAEIGTISMGGTDISKFNLSNLRRGIAYVPQETFLFSSSIRDNLLFGDVKVDDDRLKDVLDACGCSFIENLPFGLDTVLEEGGKNLSGGQRQRLAIARAMLRNPNILILDEATSSLDSYSEHHIMDSISSLRQNMTVVMSAHRLNTVCGCDKIFVLDGGSVVQQGTHEELIRKPGLYRRLWDSQNGHVYDNVPHSLSAG